MAETSAPGAKPRPEPLFRLELKSNGGVFAPRTLEEIGTWVQKEVQFWAWIDSVSGVSRGPLDQALALVRGARDNAQTAVNEAASGQDVRSRLQYVREAISGAYLDKMLPHSTSPLGKELEALRLSAPAAALGYVFPQMPEHRQHRFDSTPAEGWYGFVLGLFRAYGEPSGLRQLKGQRESFEDFLAGSKQLEAARRDELDRIENDVAGALQRTADDVEGRKLEFERFMQDSIREHGGALEAHRRDMDALRKTFREEMTLRAPVEYWESRAELHDSKASRLRENIGISFVVAGCAVGLTAHWALKTSAQPYSPDTWRLAILVFVAAVGVWAVRLLVRTLLSHMHLSTDAAERVTMVKTYLALMEAQKLPDNDDRKLILQALFRHSPDGMVRDESFPLPSWDAITKPK